mgnify:FL=1
MSFRKEEPTYGGTGFGSRNRKLVMELDGTEDYIEIGNHAVFNFTDGAGDDSPFSLSAWVQTESALDQGAIISKNSGSGVASNWLFVHDQGQIWGILYDGSGSNLAAIRVRTSSSGLLPPGEWTHVLFTYNGTNSQAGMNLYVNGQPAAVIRDNPAPYSGQTATTSPVRIGANAASGIGNEFEKFITEACVLGFEASAAQAEELYNNGRPLDMDTFSNTAGMIAWWRLGNGDSVGVDGVKNSSNSAYNGTMEGDTKIVVVRDL